MPSTGLRRRADLSGVFRISDRAILVVAADASWAVEDGVGAVGIDVDHDARLLKDFMRRVGKRLGADRDLSAMSEPI